MKKKVAIGIDIGGTNIVFGFIDEKGNILHSGQLKTQSFLDGAMFVKEMSTQIISRIKNINEDIEIIGIGIGAPNGNFYNGTIEFAPNLKWKGIIPLVELFKTYFDIPVYLTNDANAAALGEMIYGGAKNMKNFIMITLGTGLGSGIVVNSNVVYGHDGFAGEIGHVIVNEDGRQCGCGRKGCLETYCSATGIKKTVIELLSENNANSILSNSIHNGISGKEISEAAAKGDELALKAFDYTSNILGKALANAVAFTSPEAIFLFGGLSLSGDLLFKPTKRYMEDNLLQIYRNKVKILASELDGNNAAIVGAAALVWKENNS